MQPSVPMPVENRPLAPPATMAVPHAPIFFGVVIALFGIALEGAGYAVVFLASRSGQPTSDYTVLVGIEAASETAGILFIGIGLFLIFFGASRLRPASKPWTSAAAVVLLLTGILGGILRVAIYLLLLVIRAGPPGTDTFAMFQVISAASFAVGLTGSLALIAGLFGLTRSWILP